LQRHQSKIAVLEQAAEPVSPSVVTTMMIMRVGVVLVMAQTSASVATPFATRAIGFAVMSVSHKI
jgi:hypothetical protein